MISITGLRFEVGAFTLDTSIEIGRGEYFVLMGPPGAGKSMLVECLAGLRHPSAGRIEIAGRDVTAADPRDRGVGYVPQDYALFSTRSVYDNIAFGPQVRGLSRDETDRRVRDAVKLLDIERLLERRRVQGLSGGERQRVALARALAVKPSVLILDEPVSALDESTRESVCAELRRMQRELGLTTIHISHNLEEAFSVADRGAVMRGGRIQQIGRLDELLRRPVSEFVARFMRCENIFTGECRGPGQAAGTSLVSAAGSEFILPGALNGEVRFAVRPENVTVELPSDRRELQGAAVIPARLARAVDRGAYVRLELSGQTGFVVHVSPRAFAELGAGEGAEVVAIIRPESVHVIPGQG